MKNSQQSSERNIIKQDIINHRNQNQITKYILPVDGPETVEHDKT